MTAPRPGQKRVDASASYVFGLKWREPVVRTGFSRTVLATFGRPAISLRHRLVIVGTGEGDVKALGLDDGEVVWTYHHGAPFEGAVTLFDVPGAEMAVVGGRDGQLLALRTLDGHLLWKSEIGGDARAPAVRAGELLFVATSTNRVHALELATGKQVWNAGRPAPTGLTVTGHAQPLVVLDLVVGAFSDGFPPLTPRATWLTRGSRCLRPTFSCRSPRRSPRLRVSASKTQFPFVLASPVWSAHPSNRYPSPRTLRR